MDFQNDVIGKCDICFRAGYCSLTECDYVKSEEVRLVNQIVENGFFRGKINMETGGIFKFYSLEQFLIASHSQVLSQSSLKKLQKNVKKSLKNSILADNAQMAAKQVGNIVNNYVNQSANQNDKIIKRNVVYKNFILQANIVIEATDKQIDELKAFFEDYVKLKEFRTVSPVSKMNKNEKTEMKSRMKNLMHIVKNSVSVNLGLVTETLRNLDQAQKKSINFKQTILKKTQKALSTQQKKHMDSLETEINSLTDLKKPLEDIKTNFLTKLATIKSFSFRLR